LDIDCTPAKSTFNDALNKRSEKVFEKIYFALLAYFSPLLSDSRKEGVSYERFFAFDSTTIRFDKAYNGYLQFAKWTEEDLFFVCRLKDNAKYEVLETFFEQELSETQAGVMKVEHIHLHYKEDKKQKTLCLRKVTYRDEKVRVYQVS
jgi:hypothetical protein